MLEPVLYNVFLSDPGKPEYSQVRKPVMLLRAPMDELQRDLTATRHSVCPQGGGFTQANSPNNLACTPMASHLAMTGKK